MPILFRYLMTLFLAGLLRVALVFVGLFFLGDGVEQLRRHISSPHMQWLDMITLLVLRLPGFIGQLLPALALLTTLLVLTRLSKQNEITVLRASGISIYRILLPFLLGGVLLALVQFHVQDRVIPHTSRAAEELHLEMSGNRRQPAQFLRHLWLRDGDHFIYAKQASVTERVLFDVTIFHFQGHHLWQRIDARKAVAGSTPWQLTEGRILHFGEEARVETFQQTTWPGTLDMAQLEQTDPDPDYLTTSELLAMANRMREEGYDNSSFLLQFHRKLADPATTVAAILLAFPFALRLPRASTGRTSLLVGLLAGFVLFVLVNLSSALGMGGRLPPWVAAWWPVLFFASVGSYLLFHLEEHVGLSPLAAARPAARPLKTASF